MKHLQHFTAMIVVTILTCLIYVSVQQSYRTAANDPQIQLANDLSEALERGAPPLSSQGADTVSLERSMAVFVQKYNGQGQPVASTGYLNGRIPVVPRGALLHAARSGQNEITWQPEPGVRLATVIVPVQSTSARYVVVGRSLKAVEERESNLRVMVLLCWILCLAVIGINWLYYIYFFENKKLA